MRTHLKKKVGLAAVGAIALSVAVVGPAHADYQPSGTDVVGVGGDTPQYILDFLADGQGAAAGYNAANNVNKFVYFNATADLNGRAAYANGSTLASPSPLNATTVLRAGSSPVQRTQSSGAGIAALLADNGTVHKINYVASASLPTAAQQTAANDTSSGSTHNWGGLHVVKVADDSIKIATSTTTNAPAAISRADLLGIYKGTITTWSQVTGYTGTHGTDTIVPLLPPSGSTINKNFIADLTTQNTTPFSLYSSVKTVEQNDPNALAYNAITNPNSANEIVPFSTGRLDLWADNYFHDPSAVYSYSSPPATLSSNAQLLTGSGAYSSPVNDYIIFRQSDVNDPTWQPGSSLNWVHELFLGDDAYASSLPGQALINAAGVTADYSDLGSTVSSG